MKLIERSDYLKKMLDVTGTPDIKVITGIRRSGKSKLMEAFIENRRSLSPECNIIHLNFNLTEFEGQMEYHKLYDFVNSQYVSDKENIVCIDEIQMCSGFEKAINSLHECGRYDIYITSSNAFLLSSDLATLFTGRTYEIEVYPFSFKEFCTYYAYSDIYNAFDRYSREGGMSGSYLYKSPEDRFKYIRTVFDTLIVRDIKQKYKIRNDQLLYSVCDFLLDNASNITSVRNIADSLIAKGTKTNDKTVGKYVDYLCNAFAFYKVRRFNIRGKKYLASQDKYYMADHAFKYSKLGTKNLDYGRVYENIVAIELMRRGYELYAGFLYKKEIDFVALKQNEKLYIQVSDDISNSDTFAREVTPLLKIADAYPKMVLARTRHDSYQYEGVQIIDIADWLLG
ncbi:MAG: ATP-binding protein [Bacteroidales bacterium]|nr:ATP-binding protein [Bacteroidales bacterium]